MTIVSLLAALKTALVEPPVNLLLVTCVGVLLLGGAPRRGKRRRIAWAMAGGGALALLILVLPVTGWLLLTQLERDLPLAPPDGAPPAAIVILSADILRAVPGGTINPPDIGGLTLERVRAGATLHRRSGLPILVSGGVLGAHEPPVAATMARVLETEFAAQVRWVEDRSGTTWDNARYSAEMLRQEGIGSVYLVTHGWHMRRAVLAFRHFGLTVTAAPAYLTGPETITAGFFVPNARAWMSSSHALHEWIGLAWYALGR